MDKENVIYIYIYIYIYITYTHIYIYTHTYTMEYYSDIKENEIVIYKKMDEIVSCYAK
jgi:hypothetical protein